MKPIQMNGIKLSNLLAQVSQLYAGDSPITSVHLCRRLSSLKINISFLNAILLDDEKCIACCVDGDDLVRIKKHLKTAEGSNERLEVTPETGTLSVYPHRFSLKSLGHVLRAMGEERFLFYHMASSGSMLTFVVDIRDQEKIAERLARHVQLPVSHAPFRQEPCSDDILLSLKNAPETSATYVECKIKTYGIKTNPGLALCRLEFEENRLSSWGERIQSMEGFGLRFFFASGLKTPKNRIKMLFLVDVLDPEMRDKREDLISSAIPDDNSGSFSITSPVGFIRFQGPHFGDRYGIADHAFSALTQDSIPVLAAGCVGASVNMVVPEQMTRKAAESLSRVFVPPQGQVRREKR